MTSVRPFHSILLCAVVTSTLTAQDPPRRHATGLDQGLPANPAAFAPYHADPDHALNRIFRTLYLVECTPAEVGAALPREHTEPAAFFRAGWVHAKRDGTDADRRWFGGDGRQLPVEGFPPATAAALRSQLEALDTKDRAVLLDPPELAVLFQHDLLRLGQRLLDTNENPELLPVLWRAVQWAALDGNERARLRNPLPLARAAGGLPELAGEPWPAALGGNVDSPFREVLRKSTRLFDAERTLLWSRLWLAHPEGPAALQALLPKAPDQGTKAAAPTVPIGFRAVLVQGIVAVGSDGLCYASPVVVDLRTQHLVNRDGLAADQATFTRDGIHFGIWQLERERLRRGELAAFRTVAPDDQDLFRDYGTQKHTTYRAQCTLCHRNSDTPEPQLGGFPVLRPHAGAAFAVSGDERLRLAEQQTGKLVASLREAK
jgi:hypothetical protein